MTVTMDGAAMEPTIHPGMQVQVNLGVSVRRGDVVLLDLPGHRTSLRRIVAMAGEGIDINGTTSPPQVGISERGSSTAFGYEEIYIAPGWAQATSCCGPDGKASGIARRYVIPDGDVYVLSDNRVETQDSRSFGALSISSVKGRVLGDPRLPTPYPGEPWHRAGSTSLVSSIHTFAGPSHCGLQSVTFLDTGWPIGAASDGSTARSYARDPDGVLAPLWHLLGTLNVQATLPPDARNTGFRAASVDLYLSPTDQDRYAYLVGPDRVERWPRSDPPAICS